MRPGLRRAVAALAGAAGALAALVTVGGGVVYSGQLLPAPSRDRTLDVTATVTDRGTVLLPPDRRACLDRFGLLLPDATFITYAGPVVDGSCDDPGADVRVERTVDAVLAGDPPVGTEVPARFDEYAVTTADPADIGLDFDEVEVPLEEGLGTAPAWVVPAADAPEDEGWVIVVHGRSGTRAESLRLLPAIHEAGWTAMAITHRNDFAGGPETADRVGRFGASEWRDLAAAVDVARDAGARRIVLLGYSQGGSLISFYLRERGDDAVDGVVLDSPLLSLGSTLVAQARLRDIPEPLIPPILLGTRLVARVRAGFAIVDVEHVEHLATTDVPMLLIHGTEDDFVPIDASEELARRRPQALDFLRIEGAGHVEGWNAGPDRYTDAVRAFLDRV